jgi:hypothetical protein
MDECMVVLMAGKMENWMVEMKVVSWVISKGDKLAEMKVRM